MNQDVLKGKWKQIRGQMKQWWSKLTDDDLDGIEGNYDVLVGKLQERYGYAREQAEREIDHRLETIGEPAGVRSTSDDRS